MFSIEQCYTQVKYVHRVAAVIKIYYDIPPLPSVSEPPIALRILPGPRGSGYSPKSATVVQQMSISL